MSNRETDRLKQLRTENQRILINFLHTDLDLGFTFASRHSRESAMKAVTAVRRFKDRVENDEARQEIERRLWELEKLVSTV